jgi:Kef-type K+ transport system membrane component KefB
VNAIWLLMGLLALSYIGSLLVGGRAIRGMGLPSGVEYVVLGFLLGPTGLGLVDRATLATFEPFAHVALGWLMFVIGITFGMTGDRRVRPARLVGGLVVSLVSGGAVFAAVWFFLAWRSPLSPMERLLVSGGIGAAGAETTRYAVRWVATRHHAEGPVSDLVNEIAECDDLVPILAVAVLFALYPPAVAVHLSTLGWVGITVGLGLLLGAMAALLLGRTFRLAETWGVLLGMSLLAVGTAERLGLASVSALFVMGVTLSALSPHRPELRRILAPTEHAVMLPALLLAGAYTELGIARYVPYLLGTVIAARVLVKVLIGLGLLGVAPVARAAGPRLGLGLLSSGALAMSIGLAFALRFPGPVGGLVLACAAAITVFGELVGPASLRSVLTRAGETREDPPPPAKSTSTSTSTPLPGSSIRPGAATSTPPPGYSVRPGAATSTPLPGSSSTTIRPRPITDESGGAT